MKNQTAKAVMFIISMVIWIYFIGALLINGYFVSGIPLGIAAVICMVLNVRAKY